MAAEGPSARPDLGPDTEEVSSGNCVAWVRPLFDQSRPSASGQGRSQSNCPSMHIVAVCSAIA